MAHWLNQTSHPADEPVASFDSHADQQLRRMDIALALIALIVLALPLAIGLLLGRLEAVQYMGCQNKIFKLWRLRFADSYVGRILDRSGIASLPGLWNILRGDLAWVGHKPLPATASQDFHPALSQIRPGLVSIWQMRRRTAVDFGSELESDLQYLNQRGLQHDFSLLARALLVFSMPVSVSSPVSEGRISVGDVAFDNVSMAQAVKRISEMLDGACAQQVSFVNPACVNIAANDRGYRRLLARAALVLPDGIGIKIAADLLGVPLKQNVNGTDLFPRLCEMLERRDASLFLLGGQAGVAEGVANEIRLRWPLLRIVGIRDGFFSVAQEGEVAAMVSASGADVVLVARGVPMQDVFIDRHMHQLGVKVAIGVGGLFDFVSGRINRAPAWMRDSGMEWIYRLLQEPARMWRRYLLGNFTFLGRIVLQRLGLRHAADDTLIKQDIGAAASRAGGLRCVLFATVGAPADVPVVSDFPAALLPFGWSTFIERTIEQLANHGVRHIDLVVSSHPEALRQLLGQGERWGVQLSWHLAKDPATPYALLRSMALVPSERLLLGHADRIIADHVMAAMIGEDQIAAMDRDPDGVVWAGWCSIMAGVVCTQSPRIDESALGAFLCQQATCLQLLDASEFVSVESAAGLLNAQHRSMTDEAMRNLPATWLRTDWGAHSPDAVIRHGAKINGPTLIGPGCFVAAGAVLGPGTVLTHDVVASNGSTIGNSLVFPATFVGQGLELEQTIVNGRSVQHLRLDVRTNLPESDGLLIDLQAKNSLAANWFSRASAALVCFAFFPWLVADTAWRRVRGLPLRWRKRLVALGRDEDSDQVLLKNLRCTRSTGRGAGQLIAQYGAWLDVAAGHRNWFGSRPRSQSEWYALGREWQLLLTRTPVGCLHAPAWTEGNEASLEAQAAADVFYAVNQSFGVRIRIIFAVIRQSLSMKAKVG